MIISNTNEQEKMKSNVLLSVFLKSVINRVNMTVQTDITGQWPRYSLKFFWSLCEMQMYEYPLSITINSTLSVYCLKSLILLIV